MPILSRPCLVNRPIDSRRQGATAYSYSRFCALINERHERQGCEAQMRFDYEAGLWGLSDFSDETLALHSAHGETDVEDFVAVLAHSQMIYAEAVPEQSVRNWKMVHLRAQATVVRGVFSAIGFARTGGRATPCLMRSSPRARHHIAR